jgi:hypothetical protein
MPFAAIASMRHSMLSSLSARPRRGWNGLSTGDVDVPQPAPDVVPLPPSPHPAPSPIDVPPEIIEPPPVTGHPPVREPDSAAERAHRGARFATPIRRPRRRSTNPSSTRMSSRPKQPGSVCTVLAWPSWSASMHW